MSFISEWLRYGADTGAQGEYRSFDRPLYGDRPFGTRLADAAESGAMATASTSVENFQSVYASSWVHRGPGFYWFSRVHITPANFDLGNVVGDQQFVISVWNSYPESLNLAAVQGKGLDGVTLADGPSSGEMKRYEEFTYNLTVKVDGPPVIDVEVTWDFTEPGVIDPKLVATGRRLLLWPFMPQWPIDETFDWKTEVLRTYSKVTRTSLLNTPRKALQASFQLTPEQNEEAQRLVRTWGYRPFGVPDFTQFQEVGAISAGAVVLNFDTSIMDIENEGLLVIYESWDKVEIVQIETVTEGQVTLKKPTVASYSDAALCPLFSGDARRGFRFVQNSAGVTVTTVEFLAGLSNDLSEPEADDHHGIPLYPYVNEYNGTQNEGSKWAVTVLDHGVGIPSITAKEAKPVYTSFIQRTTDTPEELMAFKRWLHNRAGKRRAFALPSQLNDFRLAGTVGNGSKALTLKGPGYAQQYDKGALQMVLKDGTVYDLTVTSTSAQDDSGVAVSQTFDRDIYVEDVERISLVRKMVLSTDRVSLKHDVDGRETKIKVEEVPW